ncbi:7325_t:CDS:2 [Diversispora eburnea]|uniref:7325_t:CDS:1 n=2 Tax=Diversisporales TaxID=214509 RepID=A0A9N8UZH6_9GLOM|nr:7325_t:CDS:2 [Diversispora eburnea]
MSEFWASLSRDLGNALEDSDDYNVLINAAKLGRVLPSFASYAINDSQINGPCFGDGDLWMTDQFNTLGSCSCNKESYEQSVGDMFHRESWDSWNGKNGTFAVEDYEVFQVIKKKRNE